MAKINKEQGATDTGTALPDGQFKAMRGRRLVVDDGSITFKGSPDLRLERNASGRLAGVVDNMPGPGTPANVGDRLLAARSAMANGLLNWLVLGDSISVGYYASTEALRWTRLAASMLQTSTGDSAALGYKSKHSSLDYLGGWTSSGAVTEFGTSGFGYGATGPAANGGYIEIPTIACDRFWIFYTGGNLIGKFGVQIDGGASVNVPSLAPATVSGGHVWDSGSLTDTTHTVRITSTDATFPCRIEGIWFFRGNGNTSGSQGTLTTGNAATGSGVRLLNGSRFGSKASTFAASSAVTWWTDGLPYVQPRLVSLHWGANEYNAGDDPITLRRNMLTVVDRIDAVCAANSLPRPSYLFEVPHGMGPASTTFAPYADAIHQAAEDRGAAVFDFREVAPWVGTAVADTYGVTTVLDSDTNRIHLSDLGHRMLGQMMGDYLLRALGGARA